MGEWADQDMARGPPDRASAWVVAVGRAAAAALADRAVALPVDRACGSPAEVEPVGVAREAAELVVPVLEQEVVRVVEAVAELAKAARRENG